MFLQRLLENPTYKVIAGVLALISAIVAVVKWFPWLREKIRCAQSPRPMCTVEVGACWDRCDWGPDIYWGYYRLVVKGVSKAHPDCVLVHCVYEEVRNPEAENLRSSPQQRKSKLKELEEKANRQFEHFFENGCFSRDSKTVAESKQVDFGKWKDDQYRSSFVQLVKSPNA